MKFPRFRKKKLSHPGKNTVAGNTQRNRCYQDADFMEENKEMPVVPLLQRFPGQHMPSLWQRFFFLRHIMHAEVA